MMSKRPISPVTSPTCDDDSPCVEYITSLDYKVKMEEKLTSDEKKTSDLSKGERVFLIALVMLTLGAFSMFLFAHFTGHGSFLCLQSSKVTVVSAKNKDLEKLVLGQKQQKRLPGCIIIGVRKSGTRALLEFLNLHPDVKVAYEEVHFFDLNYAQGLEWYRQRMPSSESHQITLEKSPAYFITDLVPERIRHMNSTAKLLVIVRNPLMRTISDYTQVFVNKLARNKTFPRFEEVIIDPTTGQVNTNFKAIRTSLYATHLQKWFRIFPKSQLHFVDGDQIIKNPLPELSKVEDFLGLDHRITDQQLYFNRTRGFYCMRLEKREWCLGASKGRKHPEVDPVVVNKLKRFFRPFNQRFFNMIGQTFDWD